MHDTSLDGGAGLGRQKGQTSPSTASHHRPLPSDLVVARPHHRLLLIIAPLHQTSLSPDLAVNPYQPHRRLLVSDLIIARTRCRPSLSDLIVISSLRPRCRPSLSDLIVISSLRPRRRQTSPLMSSIRPHHRSSLRSRRRPPPSEPSLPNKTFS